MLECGALLWFLIDMQFLCFYCCCVPPCVLGNKLLVISKTTQKELAVSRQCGTKLGTSKHHIIVSSELGKDFMVFHCLI
jgi:hypothetical protein